MKSRFDSFDHDGRHFVVPDGDVQKPAGGRHHLDFAATIAGVHYIRINSISFREYSNPYRAPLFATLTLDPAGTLSLEGRSTGFTRPMTGHADTPGNTVGKEIVPKISDRRLAIAPAPRRR